MRCRVRYGTGRRTDPIDSIAEAMLDRRPPCLDHDFSKVFVRASSADNKTALDLKRNARRRPIGSICIDDKIIKWFAKGGLLNGDTYGLAP